MTQTTKTINYDWSLFNYRDIGDKYTRNKIDALHEIFKTLTPNDEYENFINIHREAATECTSTKLRVKHTVPRQYISS